jgi:hypothetical protein
MSRIRKWVNKERLTCLSHSHRFHTSHGVAHVAYFIAVMAEGHGVYALCGGIMVVFSFITIIADDV